MTPEQWSRIEKLFADGLAIDPVARQTWLLAACEDDDVLRSELVRLLDQDERAARDRFLSAPAAPAKDPDQTGSWHSHSGHSHSRGQQQSDDPGIDSAPFVNGFSPRPAIASGPKPHALAEAESVVRARLRELPMIHILTLMMANFWRCTILGDLDHLLRFLDWSVVGLLVLLIGLLWGRWRISLAWLQALELCMIGILAARLAIVEYRLVLRFTLCHEPDNGAVDSEKRRTAHRHPDSQLWTLRPQKLASCRGRRGTARALTLRNIVGSLPSAS